MLHIFSDIRGWEGYEFGASECKNDDDSYSKFLGVTLS
jgi:hypothetical protein